MSDCEKCTAPPRDAECKGCSGVSWWRVETDSEGRCLTCNRKVWPDGARPLTEEEKDVNK